MRISSLLTLSLLFAACAQGGKQTSTQGELQIAANHHIFSFRTLPGFGAVPVDDTDVFTASGVFGMDVQSNYTLTLPSGSVVSQYALGNDGSLTIIDPGSGRTAPLNLPGAYGLIGDNHEFFFVDGYSTSTGPSLGLWYGTRIIPGSVDLAGDWHLLALHAVIGQATPVISASVGRGTHGSINVATGTPGDSLAITGTGTESGTQVLFEGHIQQLLSSGAGDGSVNLTVTWINAAQPILRDDRVCLAAVGKDVVVALDADESDGMAGIVLLFRQHATATPATFSNVAGDYWVGGHTLFVNPTNAGSDAMIGTLSLTDQGAFRFSLVGSRNVDFTFTGTYTVAPEGRLDLVVDGTSEHWFGALNPDHNTIAVVDDVVEVRPNGNSELNLWLGVRKHPVLLPAVTSR